MPAQQMIREIRDAGLAAWIGPDDFVTVPTAAEGEPPREWFERLYNVRQWTPTRRGRAVNSVPGAAISPNDKAGFSPGHDSEKRVTACPTWAADRRLLRSHTSRRKPHSDDGPSAPPRRPRALSR